MKISIEGTSSSGKSSIIKLFPNNYTKVYMDDILDDKENTFKKKLKNKYYIKAQVDDVFYDEVNRKISLKIKGKENYVLDLVNPNFKPQFTKYLSKNIIKVLIYSNFENLARNILKRKNNDPRGKFVFTQFSKYYVKAKKNDLIVDKINLNDLIKSLKKIKYEFESEKELLIFAKEVFKNMNINDKKDTNITVRYNVFNLVINTTNKKPIFLKNLILEKSKLIK